VQRDMDLIRKILLALRDSAGVLNKLEGVDELAYRYHANLLLEAGLAVGTASKEVVGTGAPGHVMLFRLTWAGHDFADSVASDTIWKKAKDTVLKPSASWTFEILKEYLKSEIQRHIPGFEGILK
jgi:hypothetical protein